MPCSRPLRPPTHVGLSSLFTQILSPRQKSPLRGQFPGPSLLVTESPLSLNVTNLKGFGPGQILQNVKAKQQLSRLGPHSKPS